MTHIQPHQIHHGDAQLLNTIQEVKAHAPAGSSGQPAQAEPTHQAKETFSRKLSKENPVELRIFGFPWQFILVVVTIAIGVVGLVGKVMGIF